MPAAILCCHGNIFTKLLPGNVVGDARYIHRLSCDKTQAAQKIMHPTNRGVLLSTLLQKHPSPFPPFAECIITDCK
jgi:hypothetical protein